MYFGGAAEVEDVGYAEGGEEGPVVGGQGGEVGAAEEDGRAEGAGRAGEGIEGGVAEVVDVGDEVERWGWERCVVVGG